LFRVDSVTIEPSFDFSLIGIDVMTQLKKVILFTDTNGRARFRDEEVPLTEGTPQSQLSALMAASACQLRQSPVGFRSTFHCTGKPQWLFVLGGHMVLQACK
jgi:hypothetical protein